VTGPDSCRVLRAAALVALAAGLTLSTPGSARAQLGSLIKKATDKATEKATEKATGQETGAAAKPIGTELTDDMIARMIKGLAVTESKLGQRDELAKRQQGVAQQISDVSSREDGAIRGYDDVHERWRSCRSEQFDKIGEANRKNADALGKAMVNDPAKMNAFIALQRQLSMAYAAASQKGDTAGIRVARENLMNAQQVAMGVDFKADTARVDKLCGGEPAKPQAVVQVDSLRALDRELTRQVRGLEEQAQEQGASAAGMNLVEYGSAREKIVSFKAKAKGQLTTAELQRLRAREADIAQFKRAL
jgi:hypothetical protein